MYVTHVMTYLTALCVFCMCFPLSYDSARPASVTITGKCLVISTHDAIESLQFAEF